MGFHLRRLRPAYGGGSLVDGKKLLPNRQQPVGKTPPTEIVSRTDRIATMSNFALAKALLLFSQFGTQHPERSVTDLSQATGLSKSSISKILREFRAQGFLVQDPVSRRYRVGPQALAVGAGYFAGSDLVRCADGVMQKLAKRTDGTATLNVVCDSRVLFVKARNGGRRPAFSWPVGSYIPVHATAAGKIAAAFAAPHVAKPMIADAKLRSFTPSTICEVGTLMQQLSEIRRVGIACTFGESTYGVAAVATPIHDCDDKVVGAISVLLPLERARESAHGTVVADAVRAAARDVSREIGTARYAFHDGTMPG
jgi:DNA-binding IclR family transcriptional regulator